MYRTYDRKEYVTRKVMAKSDKGVVELERILESHTRTAQQLRDMGFDPESYSEPRLIAEAIQEYRDKLAQESLDRTSGDIKKRIRTYKNLKNLKLNFLIDKKDYIAGAVVGSSVGIGLSLIAMYLTCR
ncbi:hypothetical protein KY363_01740 [Candidatus Woesearchaeota archaeon]|nr:hypothetical protein [Candidatus Woesearchaeota archaeon]